MFFVCAMSEEIDVMLLGNDKTEGPRVGVGLQASAPHGASKAFTRHMKYLPRRRKCSQEPQHP